MPIRSKLKRRNKSNIKSKRLRKGRSRRKYSFKKQTRKRYRRLNKKNRKTIRRYKKNNKNKQKGGFYFGTKTDVNKMLCEDEGDSILNNYFNYIFKNNHVSIEPLGSEGIYGIILVIKFNDSYLRSVKDTDFAIRDYNKNPSKMMLLKIVYVDPRLRGTGLQNERTIGRGADAKKVVSREAFDYEVKIQQHVFKKSNAHLQPITPLIYYHSVHDSNNSKKFLELLRQSANHSAKPKLDKIKNLFRVSSQLNLGFIFMEMREGYITVSDQITRTPNITDANDFLGMAGEVLNRLHYTCQVTHGDLHQANILFNINGRR